MVNLSFDNREGYIWYNGNIVDWRAANVHVLNHGLHYASCVFEGERAYNGKIFETEQHTTRLFKSAESLDMSIPFTENDIIEAKNVLLKKNSLIIRLIKFTKQQFSLGQQNYKNTLTQTLEVISISCKVG